MCIAFGVAMWEGFTFGKCICNKIGVSENTTPWQVHPVSLSFCLHLSLSMNGQMAIWLYTSDSNDYLAIHTQNINIFYFEMSSQIVIQPFSIKKT